MATTSIVVCVLENVFSFFHLLHVSVSSQGNRAANEGRTARQASHLPPVPRSSHHTPRYAARSQN